MDPFMQIIFICYWNISVVGVFTWNRGRVTEYCHDFLISQKSVVVYTSSINLRSITVLKLYFLLSFNVHDIKCTTWWIFTCVKFNSYGLDQEIEHFWHLINPRAFPRLYHTLQKDLLFWHWPH